MGALCEWCRLGALENNCDPDSIGAPGFDTQLLAVWRASGEAIFGACANREDDAQTGRRLVFDAAIKTANAIRTTAIAAAESAHRAALDVAWVNMRDHDNGCATDLMDRLTRALNTGGWMTATRASAHIATCANGCSLCGFYANRKATK